MYDIFEYFFNFRIIRHANQFVNGQRAYGAQSYNANPHAGSLKSQVYFLQQELAKVNSHIDRILHQARTTPSPNRKVLLNRLPVSILENQSSL